MLTIVKSIIKQLFAPSNSLLLEIRQVFGVRVLSYVISFIGSIVLARMLGPESKGAIAVLTATVAVGLQFGNLGIQSANTYYISRDNRNIPKALGNMCIVSLLVIIVLLILYPLHLIRNSDYEIIAFCLIPIQLIMMFGENILLAISKVKEYNRVELFSTVAFPASIIVLSLTGLLSLKTSVIVYVLAAVFSLLLSIYYLMSFGKIKMTVDFVFFKESVIYGIKNYICSFAFYLMLKVDILMIDGFCGERLTGIYSLSSSMADILLLIPSTIYMRLFPEFSKNDSIEKNGIILRQVNIKLSVIMAIGCILMGVFFYPMIRYLYGMDYLEAVFPFWVLLPGIWALSISNMYDCFFAGVNKAEYNAISSSVVMVLNIVLNAFLIPSVGIIGAAIASSISYIFLMFFHIVYYQRLKRLTAIC